MTLSTGFTALDRVLGGGFEPGELITISGLPAIGKTSLLFQLMHNVCARNEGKHIFFATFEMHHKEATRRLLALASDLCMSDVIGGAITAEQMDKLRQVSEEIRHWPIWIRSDLYRVEEFIDNARELHSQHPLGLMAADYLQMMYADREAQMNHDQTPEHATAIVQRLKALAQELQVPIVIVAPYTRDILEEETMKPTLIALRKSGKLMYESDVVIFLHHLSEHPPMDKGFTMNMHVIARRKGIQTDIPVYFEPELVKFSDVES